MKNEQTKPVKVVRNIKTHHQTGYHKPVKNPTTNYPKDSHITPPSRPRTTTGGVMAPPEPRRLLGRLERPLEAFL